MDLNQVLQQEKQRNQDLTNKIDYLVKLAEQEKNEKACFLQGTIIVIMLMFFMYFFWLSSMAKSFLVDNNSFLTND